MAWESLIELARQGRGPLMYARPVRRFFRGLRLPVIRPVVALIHAVVQSLRLIARFLMKFFVREPYFH